jgi:histidine triad (HIT) family protein
MYDSSNIFARILKGEIPCNKVYEDEVALAFHDIQPSAPVHVLVVPKGEFISFEDFSAQSVETIGHFFQSIRKVAESLGLKEYRLITNHGSGAGQSVFHFHVHILSGKPLGALLAE